MNNKLPQEPIENGVYSLYIEELKKYGAYQILKADKKENSICYVMLDYLEVQPPTNQQLSNLKPLYMERYRYHHTLAMSYISTDRIPADFIFCGVCMPIADYKKCHTFSSDFSRGHEYIQEEFWKSLGEDFNTRYKKYRTSNESYEVGKFGKKLSIYRRVQTLGIRELMAMEENVVLHEFPCVNSVQITSNYPYIMELSLATHGAPLVRSIDITKIENSNYLGVIDLSYSCFVSIKADVTNIKRIILPQTAGSLELYGDINIRLKIDDIFCKNSIIFIQQSDKYGLRNYGMKKVRQLNIKTIKNISMKDIVCQYPDIESLALIGYPGIITEFYRIRELKKLKSLALVDMFGYSETDFAVLDELPNLHYLNLESIPYEAGIYAKNVLKKKMDFFKIGKLRKKDWLEKNLENPLRHWDDDEFIPTAAYQAVERLYKKTLEQFLAADNKKDIYIAIQKFAKTLNKLNEKYDLFIETQERDDLFEALETIYQHCIKKNLPVCKEVSLEQVLDWLDEMREDW